MRWTADQVFGFGFICATLGFAVAKIEEFFARLAEHDKIHFTPDD